MVNPRSHQASVAGIASSPEAVKAAAISKSRRGRNPTSGSSSSSSWLSHRSIIDNHGDAACVVLILICAGSVFPRTQPICSRFLWPPSSNSTGQIANSPDPSDLCMVFFYTLTVIVAHAVLKEYIIDKLLKKKFANKLSNLKLEQLLRSTYIASFAWSSVVAYFGLIADLRHLNRIVDTAAAIEDSSSSQNDIYVKMFLIVQLSLWIHWIPEILYLEQAIFVTKGEPKRKPLLMATAWALVFLDFILAGYLLGEWYLTLALLLVQYVFDSGIHHLGQVLYLTKVDEAKIVYHLWSRLGFFIARALSIGLLANSFFNQLGGYPVKTENRVKALTIGCFTLVQLFSLIGYFFVEDPINRSKRSATTTKAAIKSSTKDRSGKSPPKKKTK